VRKALGADVRLGPLARVYVQGSYRNRVNVRQESDVDLGVLYTGDSFGVEYPAGMTHAEFGNQPATYTYAQLKDDVERALAAYLGKRAIHRGAKAFDVHENSYRIDADVVPVFEHRRYGEDGTYICGVEFRPDNGGRIVNWPERLYENAHWLDQHYENAVAKNTATGRCYKGIVRILKSVRNGMEEAGISAAKAMDGFFVECLAWNVPAAAFGHDTWDQDVQASLAFLWASTRSAELCSEWGEVSELKHLFRGSPDSKRQQAHAFLDAAWSYVGVRSS
jgi:hypothetical protein